MEKLTDHLKWFTDRGYVLSTGSGKYGFSRKFYEELKTEALVEKMSTPVAMVDSEQSVAPSLLPEVRKPEILLAEIANMTYSSLFIHFISQAQVPARAEDTRGNEYPVNKYNEKAAVVLYKLVTNGQVDYPLLVKSTMLYYKGSRRFKKTIGNYITEGDWRTDYEALKRSASQGEEALKAHINEEIKNESGYNGYEFG